LQRPGYGSTNFKRDIPMYADLYLQGRMTSTIWFRNGSRWGEVNDGCAPLKSGTLNRVVVTSF
jgi:S-(hydroxymethyl)glutathione dehydrogenase/alcohol dehydrogenase